MPSTESNYKRTGNALIHLPQELRDEMYCFAFSSFEPLKVDVALACSIEQATQDGNPEFLPSLCRVYPESVPEFIKACRFDIPYTNGAYVFLKLMNWFTDTYGIDAFQHVRTLSLPKGYETFPKFGDWIKEILTKCTGIRSLTTRLEVESHADGDSWAYGMDVNESTGIKMILTACWFPYLVEMKHLERFELQLDVEVQVIAPVDQFKRQLVQWMKEEFVERGIKAEPVCEVCVFEG